MFIQLFLFIAYTHYILCVLLCRLKIIECRSNKMFNVGFVDPDKVHHDTVKNNAKETGGNLLRFIGEQSFCDSILFPYNYRWESYWSVVHIQFFLLDVKCNSWRIYIYIYINMCSFHWILLNIQVDKGIVEVRDPLSRGLEGFRDLQHLLQR